MFRLFASFVVTRASRIVLVLVGITAVAGYMACHVRFDFTPQSILNSGDGALQFAEQHKATFGYEDALVLLAVEATGTSDVLAAPLLEWQWAVSTQLETIPRVEAVKSIATLTIPVVSFEDGVGLRPAPLIREFPIDNDTEEMVRRRLAGFKLLDGTLLSVDRRVTVLVVMIDPEARDIDSTQPIVHAISRLLERAPVPEGYGVHMTGLPALRVDVVDSLQKDMLRLFPLAGIVFLCALVAIFRRLSIALFSLLAVLSGLAWSIALIVLAGQPLNILSNSLPVLTLIVGVSNCVHIVSRYAEETELCPDDASRAARRTMEHMALACLLTLATTAIGFASLVAARSYMLRAFGIQAAVGMLCQYLSIMFVLGTTLTRIRPPRHSRRKGLRNSPITALVGRVGAVVAKYPKASLVCGAAIVAGSLILSRNMSVNSRMLETYDDDHPATQTLHLMEDRLSGIVSLEVNLKVDDPSTFLRPDTYRNVAEFETYALAHPVVGLVQSYVDLHQEVYANFRRRPELRDVLPTDDAEGGGRIRRSAALIRRLKDIVHYRAFMSDDGCEARILMRTRDAGTAKTRVLIDDLQHRLVALFPPSSGVTFRITGDAAIHAQSMDTLVRDLFRSLLAASVIIFGIIATLFRSVRVGLIAAVPNLTPLVLTLGYMAIRGYDLNVGNAIVFAISLGIAVDNTIHFLARFRNEMKTEDTVAKAVRRTFQGTGRAIVMTAVLIVGGFAVLLLSDFLPTRRLAELCMFTMVAALFGDLLLLPACLMLFWKRTSQKA